MKKLICKILGLLGLKKCSRCDECPKKACHPECKAIAEKIKAECKSSKPKKAPRKK